jgi:hypothetical protein
MSSERELQGNFEPHPVPEAVAALFKFQSSLDGFFSGGFEFGDFSHKAGVKSYSEDQEFLANLIEFAQADGSGSSYAFWTGKQEDLSAAPVVVFGSEGGVQLVAENIHKLLELLTLDVEPSVSWDEVHYYKGEDHQPSEFHAEYVRWAAKTFNIKPIKDAKAIIAAAQSKHGQEFKSWMGKYYQG